MWAWAEGVVFSGQSQMLSLSLFPVWRQADKRQERWREKKRGREAGGNWEKRRVHMRITLRGLLSKRRERRKKTDDDSRKEDWNADRSLRSGGKKERKRDMHLKAHNKQQTKNTKRYNECRLRCSFQCWYSSQNVWMLLIWQHLANGHMYSYLM